MFAVDQGKGPYLYIHNFQKHNGPYVFCTQSKSMFLESTLFILEIVDILTADRLIQSLREPS